MKVIVDKSKELEEFIVQEYQRELSEVYSQAEEKRKEILHDRHTLAEVEADGLVSRAEKEAEQTRLAQVAEANGKLRAELAEKRDLLYEKVQEEIKKQMQELSKEKKVALVRELLLAIRERIASLGLKEEDFSFSIWKEFPKTGLPKKTKTNLGELRVEAESKHIFLEESVEQRLEDMRETLVKEMDMRI